MRSLINKIKNYFFGKKKQDSSDSEEEKFTLPGTYQKQEDVGKKVFEKTGRLREGIGQSSTVVRQNRFAQSPGGKKDRSLIRGIGRRQKTKKETEE